MARGKSPESRSWVLVGPFRPDGGAAWIADLPTELWEDTDNNQSPYGSPLRLLEDGRELGPAHSVHAVIQQQGEGRYSFWTNVVYLSSSDGSDPNLNGRTYSVQRAPSYADATSVLRAIAPDTTVPAWTSPDRPLRCALIGLGNRAKAIARVLHNLSGVETSWLVDTAEDRIRQFRGQVGGSDAKSNVDFSTALADPEVDAIFVTLPDYLHRAVAEQAFRAGKHVFLEKPIATTTHDGKAILAAWKASGRVLQIGYVLRFAPFYQAIRNVVRQGRLGPVRVINLSDQLSVVHGASFLRRWHADPRLSGGLMVHKSSHDLDLACWLLDAHPRLVSSFGGLTTFRKAPPAPYCSQCAIRSSCPYADAGLYENRTEAERADPSAFGLDRCVFGLDKKIVDNQVVAFEMDSGVRGTYNFAMQGPLRSERRITLIGDKGRLDGIFEDNRFTIAYSDTRQEPVTWSARGKRPASGHGGGDSSAVMHYLNACVGRAPSPIAKVSDALAGLVFAVAADQSRLRRRTMTLQAEDFQLADG